MKQQLSQLLYCTKAVTCPLCVPFGVKRNHFSTPSVCFQLMNSCRMYNMLLLPTQQHFTVPLCLFLATCNCVVVPYVLQCVRCTPSVYFQLINGCRMYDMLLHTLHVYLLHPCVYFQVIKQRYHMFYSVFAPPTCLFLAKNYLYVYILNFILFQLILIVGIGSNHIRNVKAHMQVYGGDLSGMCELLAGN